MPGAFQNKNRFGVRWVVINLIRLILVGAFFQALYFDRKIVLIFSIIALIITFIPNVLKYFFGKKIPAEFEIITFLFIYGILYIAEVRGLFVGIWWDITLNLIGSLALGVIGFSIMYVLYRERKVNVSPVIISLFALCFVMTVSSGWEILEYFLDSRFGFNFQNGLEDTIRDLTTGFVGALLISVFGYFQVKHDRLNVVSKFVTKLVDRNPKYFKGKKVLESSDEEILALIKRGESGNLEFKSTLRKNLHTGNSDWNVEHATLKTIVAYLNSNGGTLLIGVKNDGEIMGVEKDGFPDNDKLSLYFTNLLKYHVGNEFLPFINFELFSLEDKHVLKIDCRKSDRPVFLRFEKTEEFYVRNGPSTNKLEGRALINYIKHKFE